MQKGYEALCAIQKSDCASVCRIPPATDRRQHTVSPIFLHRSFFSPLFHPPPPPPPPPSLLGTIQRKGDWEEEPYNVVFSEKKRAAATYFFIFKRPEKRYGGRPTRKICQKRPILGGRKGWDVAPTKIARMCACNPYSINVGRRAAGLDRTDQFC